MNSTLYQRVLENDMRPSVKKLKLKCKWTFQHNDPNHARTQRNDQRKVQLSNPVEIVCKDLKRAIPHFHCDFTLLSFTFYTALCSKKKKGVI